MGADGARVAARHRAGERAVAVAQRVVQRGRQQRRDQPVGGVHTGRLQGVDAVAHERDQVVRPVRQRGVVERAHLLRDAHRVGAHLDDQRLADGPARLVGPGRDADARAPQPGDVLGAARERHHRVQRERQHAVLGGRREHRDAVRPRGVHDDLARPEAPRRREAADQARAARRRARRAGRGRPGRRPRRAAAAARRAAARRRGAPTRATPRTWPRRGAPPRPTRRRPPRRRVRPTPPRWPAAQVGSASSVRPALRGLVGRERLARARRHLRAAGSSRPRRHRGGAAPP